MIKSKVEQILKTGTTRQKIKLYMNDIALLNTPYDREPALTPEQREQIQDLLLFSTERGYYKKLRLWNKGMMYFKNVMALNLSHLYQTFLHLDSKAVASVHKFKRLETINALLDLYPDNETREKALRLAIKNSPKAELERYQENGKTYLRTPKDFYKDEIEARLKQVNDKTWLVKSYINLLKYLTDRKRLPLKAYRDLVKDQERDLISLYERCYTSAIVIERHTGIKKARAIPPYEAIEAEVTKEDLEELNGIIAQ